MTSRHPQTLRERPNHEDDSSTETQTMSALAVQNDACEEVVPACAQQHGVFGAPPARTEQEFGSLNPWSMRRSTGSVAVWTSSVRSHP